MDCLHAVLLCSKDHVINRILSPALVVLIHMTAEMLAIAFRRNKVPCFYVNPALNSVYIFVTMSSSSKYFISIFKTPVSSLSENDKLTFTIRLSKSSILGGY